MRGSKQLTLAAISLLLAITAVGSLPAQVQQPLESTLLWEISGNGLPAPSYLYGTMHVQDKRAFDFGDSVLLKLHASSIFASEVELDSAVREVFLLYMAGDSAENAEEEAERLAPSDEETAVPEEIPSPAPAVDAPDETGPDSIAVALPDDAGELPVTINESQGDTSEPTPPKRPLLRGNPLTNDFFKSASESRPDDRPAILDAYLYRLAKHEGKKLVGLESIEEQLNVFESISFSDIWSSYIRQGRRRKKRVTPTDPRKLQAMILDYYRRGDLNGIHTFFVENWPPVYYRALLTNRNHHMADRAVPHMMQGSTFIAVGAGHLPGEEGLIALFRRKGYAVRPVKATRTGLAAAYVEGEVRGPWYTLAPPAGAFSVSLPTEPIDASRFATRFQSASSDDKVRLFLWPDIGSGITYVVSYTDYPHDYMLTYDPENFLNTFGDGVNKPSAADMKTMRKIAVDGFPGREVEMAGSEPNATVRSKVILRGNRLYKMTASGMPEAIRSADADRFFNSFRLAETRPTAWRSYTAAEHDFSIRVPDLPTLRLDTHRYTTRSVEATYMAWDSNSGRYYRVQCERYSEYDQESDSATFFRELADRFSVRGDSVIADSMISRDGFPGKDIEFLRASRHTGVRARMVLKGDRLYRVWSELPAAELHAPSTEEFFGSFRMGSEPAVGNIFSPKGDRILDDITSDDSARRERAASTLRFFQGFGPEHLPRFYALIERSYPDDGEEDGGMRARLITRLADLHDSGTVSFLRVVAAADSGAPGIRQAVLSALAGIRTPEAAELFTDLVIEGTDALDDRSWSLFYRFAQDSAGLRLLFPRVLPLFGREDARQSLYPLTLMALDSGAIAPSALTPYADAMVADLRKALRDRKIFSVDDEEGWTVLFQLQRVTELVGYLPRRQEIITLLGRAMGDSDQDVKMAAALSLIRNNRPVAPAVLRKVAADPLRRLSLYDNLGHAGRLDLFPKQYATQQAIAEGVLADWLQTDYDYAPDTLRVIGEREITADGVPGRVYLFAFRYGGEESWMVGISGPQPIDRARIVTTGGRVGSNYDRLEDMSVDAHFDALLKPAVPSEP